LNTSSVSSAAELTDSRLAALCAGAARRAFLDYESRFDTITERARERFLVCDWPGTYADAAERLHLYNTVLDGLTHEVKNLMGKLLQFFDPSRIYHRRREPGD